IRVDLRASADRQVNVVVRGGGAAHYESAGDEVLETQTGTPFQVRTALSDHSASVQVDADGHGYRLFASKPVDLASGSTATLYVEQSCLLERQPSRLTAPEAAFSANAARWSGYLQKIFAGEPGLLRQGGQGQGRLRRVAVKSLETLISNWRAPRGGLRHAGI